MPFRAFGCLAIAFAGAALLAGPPSSHARQPRTIRERIAACDSLSLAGRTDEGVVAAGAILAELRAAADTASLPFAEASDCFARLSIRSSGAGSVECRLAAEAAIRIRERLQGANHIDLAGSLLLLGRAREAAGEYEGAGALFERSRSILETAAPSDSLRLAESLVLLANVRARLGRYGGLDAMYERAAGIQERNLGSEDPTLARTLKNHAISEKLSGRLARSRSLYERALQIERKSLGEEHPSLGTTYHNLANLLVGMGEYDEAVAAYTSAIQIRVKTRGEDHVDVASSRVGLALVLLSRGELIGARDLVEPSLDVFRRQLGPDHPRVATVEGVLASVLLHLGDLRSAASLAEHALSVTESGLGPESPKVTEHLVLRGQIRWAAGEFDLAEADLRRAASIHEGFQDGDPLEPARILNGLSLRLLDIGKHEAAASLIERAILICESNARASSPTMMPLLTSRARLAVLAALPDSASRDIARVRGIASSNLGSHHPVLQELDLVEASCLRASGDIRGAVRGALECERVMRERTRWTIQGLTQRQALVFIEEPRSGLDLAFTMAMGSPLPDSLNRAIWDELIRSRALVLDEMIARRRALRAEAGPEVEALQDELAGVCRELSWLVSAQSVDAPQSDASARFHAARERKEQLERRLASYSLAQTRVRQNGEIGLVDVIHVLPDRSALVAFARYVDVPRGEIPALQGMIHPEEAPRYVALVLPADRSGVVVRSIGRVSEIDRLVQGWREEAGLGAGIAGRSEALAESLCREAGERLRRRIWDPIAGDLHAADSVFLVPDGSLHLVNFDALPIDGGGYLVDHPAIIERISAERDLLPRQRAGAPGHGLLAIGNPDFDADRTDLTADSWPSLDGTIGERGSGAGDSTTAERTRRPDCGQFREIVFPPLPRSAEEARAVSRLWDTMVPPASDDPQAGADEAGDRAVCITGREATESAWKRLAGRFRAHHVATHGFYLGEFCKGGSSEGRGIAGLVPAAPAGGSPMKLESLAEDPLLLSGFVLAGANSRDKLDPSGEDGIVTAEEIAGMNLEGVEWAALSACETALGEVRSGEGVLGLHRAFRLAGAGTVVMSLWSVQDRAAEEWMGHFYEARLRQGFRTGEAVRRASKAMLSERRGRRESTHPYYWAGFVASGDGR